MLHAIPLKLAPSFFRSSESEEERHEEDWEPKKKVTSKARVAKPKAPKVAKPKTPRVAKPKAPRANTTTVAKKKPALARKRTKNAAIKEEPVSRTMRKPFTLQMLDSGQIYLWVAYIFSSSWLVLVFEGVAQVLDTEITIACFAARAHASTVYPSFPCQ